MSNQKQTTKISRCVNGCARNLIALGLCNSCYKRQYRKKNLLKMQEAQRREYHDKVETKKKTMRKYKYSVKGRYNYMKRDSSQRELECTLTFDEYSSLLACPCYYCEKQMPESMGTGLDRIDNSIGYKTDNVLTCCTDCNTLRMDHLTVEETKLLAITLRDFRNNKISVDAKGWGNVNGSDESEEA